MSSLPPPGSMPPMTGMPGAGQPSRIYRLGETVVINLRDVSAASVEVSRVHASTSIVARLTVILRPQASAWFDFATREDAITALDKLQAALEAL